MFHTGGAPLYCSAAHTHRANSAALFTPCLRPLALLMKACPLSAALSAPSCCGADYPHPESTSSTLFFTLTPPQGILIPLSCAPSSSPSSSSLSPRCDILLWMLNTDSLWMKLCMSDKNNKVNQAPALPFTLPFIHLILCSSGLQSCCLSDPHSLSCFAFLYLAPSRGTKLSVWPGSAEGGRLSCPSALGLGRAARRKVIKPPAPTVCCWWILE